MKRLRFTSCMAFLVNGMLAVMTGTIITYLVRDYGISQAAAGRMVAAQSVGNLRAAADNYRSAFSCLFKVGSVPDDSVNLGAFGLKGGLPLPPSDFGGGIAPELLQRRIGESHEEHIARVTALIRAATEAMLIARMERKRKQRNLKLKIR